MHLELYVMTLVVCWLEVDKITCVADTRISAGEATFSDSGAKLFSIPITTSIYKNGEIFNSKHHSFGFAFAGSTFLATNTHALASTCTQLLIKDAGPSLPSARSIAELYAKIGEFVTEVHPVSTGHRQ
jgi:hypothetical protein